MKILIASDSFKDASDAKSVCESIANGIRQALPEAEIIEFPLADGGEGTMAVLQHHLNTKPVELEVKDPLFRPIRSSYGLSDDRTALVEMAQASGLQLLKKEERHGIKTTSYGTGELIRHALNVGANRIILAIGGSATNDGGMGMAQALGVRFMDEASTEIAGIGGNLKYLDYIDLSQIHPSIKEVEFLVICDVDNPLVGPKGATRTYGPQKGATEKELDQLEAGMIHYVKKLEQACGREIAMQAGAGAAGGMGAASLAYLNASLWSGVELVMELSRFEAHLDGVSMIITGEGCIDDQTLNGKLVRGICKLARSKNIPVIGLCGALKADAKMLEEIGLKAAFSISSGALTLEESLAQTNQNLENLSRQLFRLLSVSLE